MFSSLYRKSDIRIADDDIANFVKIRYSKRARKMSLKVDAHSGYVVLTIPNKGNPIRALEFVQSHKAWILDRVSNLPSPVAFNDGTIIPLLGTDIEIVFCPHDKKRTHIELIDSELRVHTNLEDPSLRIKRWLKEFAREQLNAKANDKLSLLPDDRKIESIAIRDTRSRWGSCSDDGRLSFSWRLIFAPAEAFDYVVAHEVAHLIHMNHSKNFWSLCASLCDDYKMGREWMDKNGNSLMRFGQSN